MIDATRERPHVVADDALSVAVGRRRIRSALLSVVAVLTALSVAAQVLTYVFDTPIGNGLVPLVDTDAEHNVPTLYSCAAFVAAALLAALVAEHARRTGERFAGWRALAVLFVVAAVDEFVMLHELANDDWLSALGTGGPLYFAWVIPGAVVAIALMVALRVFVRRLSPPVRRLMVIAASLFIGAALGLEMVEGLLADADGGRKALPRAMTAVLQEALEMVAVVLFIDALILELLRRRAGLRLRWAP